jgi:hypothetical protein
MNCALEVVGAGCTGRSERMAFAIGAIQQSSRPQGPDVST